RHTAVLAFLEIQTCASDLQEGEAGGWIVVAFLNFNVRRGTAFRPLLIDVVEEFHRHILVDRVVIHALRGDCESGYARVNLLRSPGLQALIADLFWKAVGIARGEIGLLRDFARYLVIAVT